MSNIVNFNWHKNAKDMAWIVCPCGSNKWLAMVDDEECAELIRAIRCGGCGSQVDLVEPGRLNRKNRVPDGQIDPNT